MRRCTHTHHQHTPSPAHTHSIVSSCIVRKCNPVVLYKKVCGYIRGSCLRSANDAVWTIWPFDRCIICLSTKRTSMWWALSYTHTLCLNALTNGQPSRTESQALYSTRGRVTVFRVHIWVSLGFLQFNSCLESVFNDGVLVDAGRNPSTVGTVLSSPLTRLVSKDSLRILPPYLKNTPKNPIVGA